MTLWLFLGAAALLSVERISYLWIWYRPEKFRLICQRMAPLGGPVEGLKLLFYGFKVLQGAVFLAWCEFLGAGALLPSLHNSWGIGLGLLLLALGQLLNWSVFYRLGKDGVFYGNRFGYPVKWCRAFPFSAFEHPQYVGALLSIWGFFLVMRFPQTDWYWLPLLETLYYGIGAYLER